MLSGYEEIEDNLFTKEGGVLQPDKLADDLALIIDTDFGLVVILGCAHRGIVNTLRHAQKLTGKELVYAAIGGTHLFRASDERIETDHSRPERNGNPEAGRFSLHRLSCLGETSSRV